MWNIVLPPNIDNSEKSMIHDHKLSTHPHCFQAVYANRKWASPTLAHNGRTEPLSIAAMQITRELAFHGCSSMLWEKTNHLYWKSCVLWNIPPRKREDILAPCTLPAKQSQIISTHLLQEKIIDVRGGQDFYGNSPKTCRMLTQFQGTAKLSSGWSLLLRGDFVVYALKLPCVICFTPWPHSQKERLSWISKPKWGMETHQHPCEHVLSF